MRLQEGADDAHAGAPHAHARAATRACWRQDPDSLAYHNAAKNVFRRTTVGAHGKTKRVKGEANPQPVV